MQTTTVGLKSRSISEWLCSLPTLIILLLVIFLSSGQIIHSQLLKFGEQTWEDYFLLRGAGVIERPSCDRNPDLDRQVRDTIERRKADTSTDPPADIPGPTEIDAHAIR
mgnify:CR=1 FL=1